MLKQIHLKDFRSWQTLDVDFNQTTIFVGRNGAGKTNIVEAVRFLSLAKSFRTRRLNEIIALGGEAARIVGKADGQTIEVGLTQTEKAVKINGVIKPLSQVVGRLKTVLFSPDDMALLTGPPSLRRRFLDGVIVQKNRHYLAALSDYQNIVKRRNAVLELIAAGRQTTGDLAVWDDKLIELAAKIHADRKELVGFVNARLPEIYKSISGDQNLISAAPEWSEISYDKLARNLNYDVQLRFTTAGPHHDDFKLVLNGNDIGRIGSRGENRTAIVALKIVEVEYLKNGSAPVLLLDDIFSELDHNRRERLQKLIENYQTVITTTDEHYIGKGLKMKAKIVRLD